MPDKSGWVIKGDLTYWGGRTLDKESFYSDDVGDAIIFARSRDAERVKVYLLNKYAFALRVVEITVPEEKQ